MTQIWSHWSESPDYFFFELGKEFKALKDVSVGNEIFFYSFYSSLGGLMFLNLAAT